MNFLDMKSLFGKAGRVVFPSARGAIGRYNFLKTGVDWALGKTPLLVGAALLAGSLFAQQKHTVVVPYDHTKPISEQTANQFYLEYETFQTLWKQAKIFRENGRKLNAALKKEPEDSVVSSALYRIFSTRDRLTVEGKILVSTRGKAWQSVPLKFAGVNISSIELDDSAASFTNGAVLIEEPGQHEITVKFELPLDEKNQAATWSIPQASATLLEITMDSEFAEPVLLKNWPMSETTAAGKKVYLAAIGQQNQVEFRRRLKTSGRGMTQPNVATIRSHLFVAQGLERLEANFELTFQGQEENSFTIDFDESITPVQFEIPNLQSWKMVSEKQGMRSLQFELTQPVRDRLDVKMIGERLIDALGGNRDFPQMNANAARVVQVRSVARVSDLDVVLSPGGNHRQMEFVNTGVDLSGFVPVASYSLAGKNEALSYVLSERDSERSAIAEYLFQAGRGKLETVGQFQMRSPDGPLLSATITLPKDGTIQSVDGNRVRDWWRTGDELFVRFSGPTPQVTALLVYITQELDADATEIAVAPFGLVGFDDNDISGSGLIVTHVKQNTVVDFDQGRQVVREVGADEVGKDFEILAPLERKRGLKFERGNFSGTVRLTPITPKFDSAWVMLAQAHESWLDVSIRADLEITQSAIDRVQFSTLESVPELRVISDDVREVKTTVADGRRNYEVRFQKFVTDAIYFNLETEIPHSGTGELPDVVFVDASREARFLIVENQSSDRMKLSHAGVQTTVESMLPYTPDTLLSADLFRAPSANWNVEVTVEKLETSAGNEASISYAELTTAFRANGEEWVRAVYHLQNRSLQFLPVDLPEAADLVSVRVSGNDVRADRGEVEGRSVVLVPLIQTKPGQLAYDVELVFRKRDRTSKNGKLLDEISRTLNDPEVVGVTVGKTLWNVYLPAGHKLDDAEGNMDRVQAQRNTIEKLRSDLAELETLNLVSGDDDNGLQLRNVALGNGGVLVQRLEAKLSQISDQDEEGRQLKEGLEKQKIIITENRIEMPIFDTKKATNDLTLVPEVVEFEGFINYGTPIQTDATPAAAKKGKVTWGANNIEFETRNTGIELKVAEQIDKVRGQQRLNDSISLGNKFFNNDAAAYQKNDAAQQDTLVKGGGLQGQQIGKLSGNGKASSEVDEKLSVLNYAQIGHGGYQGQQAEQAQSGAVVNSNGYIQLGGGFQGNDVTVQQADQLSQTTNMQTGSGQQNIDGGVQMENQSYNNARSSLSKGMKSKTAVPQKPVAPALEPDPFGDTPTVNQPKASQAAVPAAKANAGFGLVANPVDDAFRAKGRQSVAVDFPVEGMVYHFQKLKDHAELTIDSSRPADLERGKWLLWMLLCLGLLLVGYGLAGKVWSRYKAAA